MAWIGLQDSEPGVIRNDNQLSGRDIDNWGAIAKDLDLRVAYVLMDKSPQLLAAMDERRIDVVGWPVSQTPANEAKYLLTDTILSSAEVLDRRTFQQDARPAAEGPSNSSGLRSLPLAA